jgi:hypothetical protein
MKEKLINGSTVTGESVKVPESETGNEPGSLKRIKNAEPFKKEVIKINLKGQRGNVNPRLEQFI